MKFSCLIIFGIVGFVYADGVHGQRHGRRGRQQFRRGRQEVAPPPDSYSGAEAPTDSYGAGDQPQYNDDNGALDNYAAASDESVSDAASDELASLQNNIPGEPGTDYPIFAEVPESGFACDGQVDGGYYADPEADCQAFHICTSDGQGGLAKYSFLCPNGTIFNQNYFICDWWFNFDCAEAENLWSLNEDIAAERESIDGAASAPQGSYGSPDEGADDSYGAPGDQANYDDEARAGRKGRRQGRRFRAGK